MSNLIWTAEILELLFWTGIFEILPKTLPTTGYVSNMNQLEFSLNRPTTNESARIYSYCTLSSIPLPRHNPYPQAYAANNQVIDQFYPEDPPIMNQVYRSEISD